MSHTVEIKDGAIVIRVPLTGVAYKNLKLSATGKSRQIASTNGNVDLEDVGALIGAPGDVKIGLNIYAVIPKADRK